MIVFCPPRPRVNSRNRPNEGEEEETGDKPEEFHRARLASTVSTESAHTHDMHEDALANELRVICDTAHRHATVYRDTARAIKGYNEVLSRDGSHVRALSNLGALYHRDGNFEMARSLYLRALEAQPNSWKTTYNIGRLEHDCGRYGAARQMYESALEMDCDDKTACNALAYLGLIHQA